MEHGQRNWLDGHLTLATLFVWWLVYGFWVFGMDVFKDILTMIEGKEIGR